MTVSVGLGLAGSRRPGKSSGFDPQTTPALGLSSVI